MEIQGKIFKLFLVAGLIILMGCGIEMRVSNLIYDAKAKLFEGDTEESVSALKKALTLNPENLEANVTMARVQYQMGNMDQAEAYALKVLRADPDEFRALGILGLVDLRKGRYKEGIHRVSKAMDLFNRIEPVGGSVPVEPEIIMKKMKTALSAQGKVPVEEICQLERAFWAKIEWYEFDEEYRKWHFNSFYEVRPDGGDTFPN